MGHSQPLWRRDAQAVFGWLNRPCCRARAGSWNWFPDATARRPYHSRLRTTLLQRARVCLTTAVAQTHGLMRPCSYHLPS